MSSKTLIAGVDEVGRGPLFGTVVAAAVILDPENPIEGLMDSKKLTEKKREALYDIICDKALAYSITSASVEEIDEINILHASMLAMKRAIESLSVKPTQVLVDGNRLPDIDYPAEAIIKGDQKIEAISAASIIAKVTRDREIVALDKIYPGYGLAKHKGYPTKQHIEALKSLGVTPLHRRSFGPVKQLIKESV